MTSEYGTIQIDWQPVLKPNGEQVISKDGTPIVESPVMTLTPKLQGGYGGWAFEDLDGFWTYRGAATDIVQGAPSEVVLSLGGHKQNGTRYQNISRIKALGGAGTPAQGQQQTWQGNNAPAPAAPPSGDARNESIREQAFYNNLNIEVLALLPADQQEALLVAYFDTAMLMMRDSVRQRALAKLEQQDDPRLNVPDSPMVDAAIEAGAKVISVESAPPPAEDVTELPW
tara:strand:- start:1462 stop:2145 length:684 start_codon:yes stop_codon:yes gene_type:complete